MRFESNHIYIRVLSSILIAISLLTSCQREIILDEDFEAGKHKLIDAYLSFTINSLTDLQTKSNPTGGENGDGNEVGLDNENKIDNITIVLYKGDNINSAVNTLPSAILFVSSSDILPGNTTTVQKVKLEKSVYHVIVIANAGDLTSSLEGKTMKEISDHIQQNAWINAAGGIITNFVMSSANDAQINLTTITTEAHPASAIVDVERIAARIDMIPNQGVSGTNRYAVISEGQTVAYNTITKIKLINRITAGSYLLKRVASTVGSTPTYLGDESPSSGIQTNYVIDPWSSIKTKSNLAGNHFNKAIGGSGSDPATALYSDYFNSSFSLNADNNIKSNISGKSFYILGYTLENTTSKESQLNGYVTGAMFETTYIPQKITNYNASTKKNEIINNSSAITFFTADNGNSIYNSLEGITFASVKTGQSSDFFSQVFTTSNTWYELQQYASLLNDNDLLGFKAYLKDLAKGKTQTDHLTRTISWTSFIQEKYGYSYNGSTVSLNNNNLDTKSLLTQQGIKTYEGGLSYYPYWIKHSNNNSSESGIMKFAIVRNNVYKLKVVSFSGLGKPNPYNPDTDDPGNPSEETYVNIVVTVKPWKLIDHPEIIL